MREPRYLVVALQLRRLAMRCRGRSSHKPAPVRLRRRCSFRMMLKIQTSFLARKGFREQPADKGHKALRVRRAALVPMVKRDHLALLVLLAGPARPG